MKNVVNKWWY